MTMIALDLLDNDPQSSNVCTPEVLEKLRRNIERSGLYPPLIVRPRGKKSKRFIIIDGHHRKHVLASLGYTEAECLVWAISAQDAQIALATLNTLRGTEDLKKRAELLYSLALIMPVDALAQLIPEASDEIQDMLALLENDIEALDQAVQDQMAAEKASLPVPLSFLIRAGDLPCVEEALCRFQQNTSSGKADRGESLIALCTFALKQSETE